MCFECIRECTKTFFKGYLYGRTKWPQWFTHLSACYCFEISFFLPSFLLLYTAILSRSICFFMWMLKFVDVCTYMYIVHMYHCEKSTVLKVNVRFFLHFFQFSVCIFVWIPLQCNDLSPRHFVRIFVCAVLCVKSLEKIGAEWNFKENCIKRCHAILISYEEMWMVKCQFFTSH